MRKAILILMLIALAGLMVSPAAADFGNFSASGEGYQDDLLFSPSVVGASPQYLFSYLYMKEIGYYNRLTAIRYYWMPRENMTVTGTAGYPSLPDAGNTSIQALTVTDYTGGANRTIATGYIGWSMALTDRDSYVYMYFNTWDTEGLTGERYLQLWYNVSAGYPRFNPHVVAADPTWGDNFVTVVQDPAVPRWFIPVEGIRVEYADAFENGWENIPTENFYYDDIKIDRTINDITYRSHIKINQTDSGGMNHTLIDELGVDNLYLAGVYNQNVLYIECVNPVNNKTFSKILYETATYPSTGDIYVYTYDGSKGTLLNEVLVTQYSVTWPGVHTFNLYGYTGINGNPPGMISFWGKVGHEYNFTAEYTGFGTVYTNYTVSTFPAIVKMYLFPYTGYSSLEFYVTGNTTGRALTGIPIKVTNTTGSGTWGKLTVNGFARFGTTSGHNYGYTVGEGLCDCDTTTDPDGCYQPTSGNVTATSGQTRVNLALLTCTDTGEGAGGDAGPSTPHEAAESVMETIYSMLPGLLLLVFLFLFLGVMGYNPGRMMRR